MSAAQLARAHRLLRRCWIEIAHALEVEVECNASWTGTVEERLATIHSDDREQIELLAVLLRDIEAEAGRPETCDDAIAVEILDGMASILPAEMQARAVEDQDRDPYAIPDLARQIADMAARMAGYMEDDLDSATTFAEDDLEDRGRKRAAMLVDGMRSGIGQVREADRGRNVCALWFTDNGPRLTWSWQPAAIDREFRQRVIGSVEKLLGDEAGEEAGGDG